MRGPPAWSPLPEGVVTIATCTRNVVSIASTVENTVLRSQSDLGHCLATVTPFPYDIAVLRQNDFEKNMIVVAVGDATALGVLPCSVRISSVRSVGGVLAVDYEKHRPLLAPTDPTPGGPPRAACYHAVAVPTSGMPVQFAATPVAAQIPWN